jgi:2-isopropylmalate synthase
VPNIGRAVISVHCHNDLGLAVANSLAAVSAGARQVECTINGIGERAGNASLEEIVMGLRTRHDFFRCATGINTRELYPTSRLVSTLTGLVVQRNKAIVGRNAFAHEAGIHIHGVLAKSLTYEIMRPADVGVPESEIVIGKHSGKHAVAARLKRLGYRLSEKEILDLTQRVKDLADKKKIIYDADLEALVRGITESGPAAWSLERLLVSSGRGVTATATVRLRSGKQTFEDAACGSGPVDAAYNAIDRITGCRGRLTEYRIEAVTGGRDAQGEVHVAADFGGREVPGRGSSTDIIEASALAYLAAVNFALRLGKKGPKKRAGRKDGHVRL